MYTSHTVTMILRCSFSLKVVTGELGLGSKVDTGRREIIPVTKNSKNCLSTLIVLVVHK